MAHEVQFGGHREPRSDRIIYQPCLVLAVQLLEVEPSLILMEYHGSVVVGDCGVVEH